VPETATDPVLAAERWNRLRDSGWLTDIVPALQVIHASKA